MWGWGQLALGDARGWLLAVLEVGAVAALAGLGWALLETDRSDLLFLGLVGFMGVWGAQAVAAYRAALRQRRRPGGAIQILALAPVLIVLFTGFWVAAGTNGSPASVLQRYVSAWRAERPAMAAPLYLAPISEQQVRDRWQRDDATLRSRLAALLLAGPEPEGVAEEIDPDRPFESLQFDLEPVGDGPLRADRETADASIVAVRHDTVDSTFFGLFPAATVVTVPVEQLGRIRLRAVARDLPILGPVARDWRVEAVEISPR